MHSRSDFLDTIASLVGGWVAEKEIFEEITTGASDDLRKATSMAKSLITEYGMSDKLPPRTYGEHESMIFLGKEIHEQRDYSEKTAELIDHEIEKIIENAVTTARNLIQTHRDKLDKIVSVLLEKETIEREEFNKLFS